MVMQRAESGVFVRFLVLSAVVSVAVAELSAAGGIDQNLKVKLQNPQKDFDSAIDKPSVKVDDETPERNKQHAAPFAPQGKMPIAPEDIPRQSVTVEQFKPPSPAGATAKVEKQPRTMGVSLGFWHAFIASLSVIIVSELGDKTWFIAAIMAMRHSRLTVFFGAMAALGLMTVLSASLGWATQIIPRKLTYYVSTALFALFGLKMLKDGWQMSPNEGQEEYEEAQAEVQKKESEYSSASDKMALESSSSGGDVETGLLGGARRTGRTTMSMVLRFVSMIFVEAFTLTFIAEWGDRSQITTIILAAREDVVGVTVGGILGHALCTGLAVIGGRLIAQRISIRTVTLIGGVVFIIFALSALVISPEDSAITDSSKTGSFL